MKIEGFLKDIGGASKVTKARRMLFKNASSEPVGDDPVRALSDALHPEKIRFIVREIRDSSPFIRSFDAAGVSGEGISSSGSSAAAFSASAASASGMSGASSSPSSTAASSSGSSPSVSVR